MPENELMRNELKTSNSLDAPIIESFATHIETFSTTLSGAERSLLEATITSLMSPHDRIRLRNVAELLDETEQKILSELESQIDRSG